MGPARVWLSSLLHTMVSLELCVYEQAQLLPSYSMAACCQPLLPSSFVLLLLLLRMRLLL